MAKRLAFFGPAGTFTEEAALTYDSQAELLPFNTIAAVAEAVASGKADEGVVPIENSIQGSVNDTLDVLIHESNLRIRNELVLPIEHNLLVKPGTRADAIKVIFSHPQALGQCRRYLERHFPKAQAVASLSTAAAVEEVVRRDDAAAIAPRRAAELYGAEILARGIQDRHNNLTRFIVLAESDHPRTGRDRTSIAFSFAEDKPGQLVGVLQEFATRSINLSKLESRPSQESLGRYIFLADLEGHREDPAIAESLSQIQPLVSFLKVFGSYPRHNFGG